MYKGGAGLCRRVDQRRSGTAPPPTHTHTPTPNTAQRCIGHGVRETWASSSGKQKTKVPYVATATSAHRVLILPYNVQLQRSEDSDTFSACWVVLVFPYSIKL